MLTLKKNPTYQRLLANLKKPEFENTRFPTESDLIRHTTMRLYDNNKQTEARISDQEAK